MIAAEMKCHPATELFPLMDDATLARLAADIKAHGLLVPVTTYQGAILDGRNRLRACEVAGARPRYQEWTPTDGLTPTAWVVAVNLQRRHLTTSQRATVAVEMLPLLEQEAKERQRQAGVERAAITNHPSEQLGQKTAQAARSDNCSPKQDGKPRAPKSREQAAKAAGTNPEYVRQAEKLKEDAPDLFEQVQAGVADIPEASKELARRKREAKRQREEEERRTAPAPVLPAQVVLDVADAARLPLPENCVDLIVTSPPYGLGKDYGTPDLARDWTDALTTWLQEMHRVSRPGGRLALNVPLDTTLGGYRASYAQAVECADYSGWTYRSTIVWVENNISKSTARGSVDSPSSPHVIAPVEMIALFSKDAWGRGWQPEGRLADIRHEDWLEWTNGLWRFSGESQPWEGHPAAFPLELPRRLIQLLTFPGDTVLDPFVGSGTTAVAALRLGRRFYGYDQSRDYVDSAGRRLAREAV